jgi:hypothetical protein
MRFFDAEDSQLPQNRRLAACFNAWRNKGKENEMTTEDQEDTRRTPEELTEHELGTGRTATAGVIAGQYPEVPEMLLPKTRRVGNEVEELEEELKLP